VLRLEGKPEVSGILERRPKTTGLILVVVLSAGTARALLETRSAPVLR
jgi:hypothetical protein